MEKYILKDNKKLRYGHTTGSCATAAAKAAAHMLLSGELLEFITIDTPKGWELNLAIEDIKISEEGKGRTVSCAVRKDAGDDPDVTNGILIYAAVSANSSEDIIITGGKGVGQVTKKGLDQPKGSHAINSTPRKMICQELDKVRNELVISQGFHVEISVPEGERLAEKTFNPKLGIIGGISILGTTGIVEPMSEKALSESIFLEMNVIKENNQGEILVFPGNYGRQYARDQLGMDVSNGVKISNYFGEMLNNINRIGYKKVLLVGHIGKLIKLAGGIMNTHSWQSDGRMEILAAYSSLMGGDTVLTEKILGCVTCDEAIEHIAQAGIQDKVFDYAVKRMIYHMRNKIGNDLQLGVVVFSNEYGTLAMSEDAEELMKGFR